MEQIKNIEKQENFGVNVKMIIDLIRHGEKDEKGALTEKGEKEAKEFGEKIIRENPESSGIKNYSSDVPRAIETGDSILGDETKFKQRLKSGLSFTGKLSDKAKEKFISLVNKKTKDETLAVQAIIDTNDKRMDSETISSKEVSQEVAKQILTFIKMTERLKKDSIVNVVMTSHSGWIENFLVDILNEERQDFMNKIGGQLDFLEGVKIIIDRKNKNNITIDLTFRDYNIKISEDELNKIINN